MFLKALDLKSTGNFVIYPFDHHIKVSFLEIAHDDTPSEELNENKLPSRLVRHYGTDECVHEVPFGLDATPGLTAMVVEIWQRLPRSINDAPVVNGMVEEEDPLRWFTVAFQDVVLYILNDHGKTVDSKMHTLK